MHDYQNISKLILVRFFELVNVIFSKYPNSDLLIFDPGISFSTCVCLWSAEYIPVNDYRCRSTRLANAIPVRLLYQKRQLIAFASIIQYSKGLLIGGDGNRELFEYSWTDCFQKCLNAQNRVGETKSNPTRRAARWLLRNHGLRTRIRLQPENFHTRACA